MNDLELQLRQFTGTETYYRHPLGLLFTDGVKFLADSAGAYWLLDVIASYQPQCRKDAMLAEFQLWTLTVNADRSAVVKCERDADDEAFRQEIEFTDFPLREVKLYVCNGVVMLAGEY